MTFASRLGRVIPRLSAQQRAVLILRAMNAGEEPTPDLRRIDDERERREFNRLMALLYVANAELFAASHAINYHAQRLASDKSVDMLREAGGIFERDTGAIADPKVVRSWRRQKEVNVFEFLLGIADDMRRQKLDDVLNRCKELKALELAWQTIAAEFEGESILELEVREEVDDTWRLLQELLVSLDGPKRLPEPDHELTGSVLARIESSLQHLALVEHP